MRYKKYYISTNNFPSALKYCKYVKSEGEQISHYRSSYCF